MKMKHYFIFFLTFCLLCSFTHNSSKPYADEVYTGRLEIVGPCAQRVVSIISSNANKARVDSRWRDPLTKEVYEYTFSVKNFCDLSSFQEGDTFTFRFSSPKVRNPCPSCLMYRPVPGTERFISILHKGSLEPIQISKPE